MKGKKRFIVTMLFFINIIMLVAAVHSHHHHPNDDLHEAGPTGRAAMPQPPSSPRKRFMLQQRMHDPLPLSHSLRAHGQRTELRIRRHPVYGYDHRTFITTAGKTSQKLLHLS